LFAGAPNPGDVSFLSHGFQAQRREIDLVGSQD
jgi:hypothetical protein